MTKKEMAAKLMKVGVNRIRFDPANAERIDEAITRSAMRAMIKDGAVSAKPEIGNSRGRWRQRRHKVLARGRGPGSRKGAKGANLTSKRRWIIKVRGMRWRLLVMRDRGTLSTRDHRTLYRQVKAGQVRTLKHLQELVRRIQSK